ncbi:AraC family transcriptional regulator [Tenacibaculum caenipelagi]|uniref:AraC family transcriptional regulator n=1 Tax=Tenacibaculum caenipelagi TaxID=1325435 RepID=A0A4R6TEB6_9FLAO|nr:helix-turn-helix domain-containing protein [Tenacibaculum caenipelagi]TDQ25446.1 AraC family transcriptional regulator [Tenacibaculum caenipelagi]
MQKNTVNELKTIRKYYRPIQPTVAANDNEISYQEIQPNKKIENYVYCFWQLKTQTPLNKDYNYRVVSDGCIDIFFNHKQPAANFVMGFCRKYVQFPIGKEFDYIGIRFLPSAFPLLFNVNAKTLSNQSQELNKILPNFSEWINSEIKPSDSFKTITKILNQKIIEFSKNQDIHYDYRFLNSLNLIFQKNGYLDTEKDLNTGLSPRQLRRIFNFYIGTTAKSFSNVVRFQHILNANPSIQSLKENKLYFDVGFFDQAHFIKNFKTFYEVTPSEAFR